MSRLLNFYCIFVQNFCMKYCCFLGLLSLFLFSCGSQPESDIVGLADQDVEYRFTLNPLYNEDTTVKQFAATLYLHSNLPGHTQFNLRLDGTRPGLSYVAALYDRDTLSPIGLAFAPRLTFPTIPALDTTELAGSGLELWDMDSLISSYQGYLVVTTFPVPDSLTEGKMLIKGRIGKE